MHFSDFLDLCIPCYRPYNSSFPCGRKHPGGCMEQEGTSYIYGYRYRYRYSCYDMILLWHLSLWSEFALEGDSEEHAQLFCQKMNQKHDASISTLIFFSPD